MSTWALTKSTYWLRRSDVHELCTGLFGPENDRIHDHGRWAFDGGKVAFRYEKDLTWFLIKAPNLADVIGGDYTGYTISTGPK